MRLRPLSLAAIVSATLCATTIILWILTAASARRVVLLNTNLAIYAWREGIGFRIVTAHTARSWDLGYFPLTLLTLAIPGAWAWRRWPANPDLGNSPAPEAILRKRIRSLLPSPVAVYLIVGTVALAIDTRHPAVCVFAGVLLLALVENIVSRHRLKTRLSRLLTGRCPTCGYSLTANVSGVCPECGTPSPASV